MEMLTLTLKSCISVEEVTNELNCDWINKHSKQCDADATRSTTWRIYARHGLLMCPKAYEQECEWCPKTHFMLNEIFFLLFIPFNDYCNPDPTTYQPRHSPGINAFIFFTFHLVPEMCPYSNLDSNCIRNNCMGAYFKLMFVAIFIPERHWRGLMIN